MTETAENSSTARRYGTDEAAVTVGTAVKRITVPEKGSVTIVIVREGYAKQEVHWTESGEGKNAKRVPYRCMGDGCEMCIRVALDPAGNIAARSPMLQIWAAQAGKDGYTPGLLNLSPTAHNAINDLAKREGKAFVGSELELWRDYFEDGSKRYKVAVTPTGRAADIDAESLAALSDDGPTNEEMELALGVPQPAENRAAWAKNLAAGKPGNSTTKATRA